MKTFSNVALALAIVIVFASGCKKKPDGIEGTWRMTSMQSGTYDIMQYYFAECDYDNTYTYGNTNGFVYSKNSVCPNDTSPQQTTGTYTLVNDTLTVYNSPVINNPLVYTNVEVNEEEFAGTIALGAPIGDVRVVMKRE